MADGSVRRRFFEILEPAVRGDRTSRAFDLVIVAMILASVAAAVMRSAQALDRAFGRGFDILEVVTVLVFTLEYLARLWTCREYRSRRFQPPVVGRLRFMLTPAAIADALAVVPFYLTLLVVVEPHLAHVLPVLRLLKLMRYSPALEMLGGVFYHERRTLAAAATIMLILLLFSSSVIYLVEREVQPEVFASIPDAMWWGIATLTTVGYGDVTPVTPLGKLFGSIVTVLGIGMFALPAGILATGFAQEMRHREFVLTWNLVAAVPIFSGLGAAEIARIARLLVPQVVQAGQTVVRRGDKAEQMFFVVSGELEVATETISKSLDGDFFGEIALLTGGTRSATVSALTRAQLLVLEASDLRAFLDDNPEIAETIDRVARERLESGSR